MAGPRGAAPALASNGGGGRSEARPRGAAGEPEGGLHVALGVGTVNASCLHESVLQAATLALEAHRGGVQILERRGRSEGGPVGFVGFPKSTARGRPPDLGP